MSATTASTDANGDHETGGISPISAPLEVPLSVDMNDALDQILATTMDVSPAGSNDAAVLDENTLKTNNDDSGNTDKDVSTKYDAITTKSDPESVIATERDTASSSSGTNGKAVEEQITGKNGTVNGTRESSPSFTFPSHLTPHDGKIIQHVYAITKLEHLLENVKKAKNSPSDDGSYNVVLMPYLACMSAGSFYIADTPLSSRVDIVAHYKLFKQSPPPSINDKQFAHVPYDHQDTNVAPVNDLPSESMAQKCAILYEGLLNTVLMAYRKRLKSQSVDPSYIAVIQRLISLSGDDFDCGSPNMARLVMKPENLGDDNLIETLLVDSDIRALVMCYSGVRQTLSRILPRITLYKSSHGQPPTQALWEVIGLTIRLNDLYTSVRRLGRQVLNANHVHLTDQKFLFQSKNGPYLRHVLSKMETIFNGNRKNGTLVATLTRVFMRQSTSLGFANDNKTVRDFANFLSQGWVAVDQCISAIEDFVTTWISAEAKFRAAYDLPRDLLIEVSQQVPKKEVKKEPKQLVKKESKKELAPPTVRVGPSPRGSRSSSVSSVQSTSSIRTPKKSPMRPSPSPIPGRSDSSSSLSSLQSQLGPAPTRARSNSSPVQLSKNAATSGAAAALKATVGRSPLKRSPAAAVSPTPQRSTSVFTSSTKNVQKQLLAVSEENSPSAPSVSPSSQAKASSSSTRLSAQQRLQQHLKQASKSGTLNTQQREVLVPVSFDPANPKEYQIRRERSVVEQPVEKVANPLVSALPPGGVPAIILPASVMPEFSQPTFLGKATPRDVQTRRNTVRNSKMITEDIVPPQPSLETRKVRFTGVPEWSEEEDTPTDYASRILKNFAVIRPSVNSHQAFRKKESQLKREESIQWRHQLHHDE